MMPAIPWKSFSDLDVEQDYLVMASRLPLQSYAAIPLFLRLTLDVRRQLAQATGLAGYSLLAEPLSKTFWTLSAWRSGDDLSRFARELPHIDVMRRLRRHMGRSLFTTWQTPGRTLPVTWREAKARLDQEAATAVAVQH